MGLPIVGDGEEARPFRGPSGRGQGGRGAAVVGRWQGQRHSAHRGPQPIDDAAALLGETGTGLMIKGTRLQAMDVPLDQRLFRLGAERYDAFVDALDHPPARGPKLRSLLRRVPAW